MISYQLSIITPSGKVFDGQVESLIAPGESGFFGILGNHAPIIASLKAGPLTVKQNSYDHFFAVGAGVLEVNAKSEALLLTDYAAKTKTYEEAKTFVTESEISVQ
jgi:F-type H+-transporting ATPase subunit epsilon